MNLRPQRVQGCAGIGYHSPPTPRVVEEFPDGRWIACVHASSHGEPGGGTIVTRDDSGEIHVFFGHVCGHLRAQGDTLEEFYRDLRGYNGVKENSWRKRPNKAGTPSRVSHDVVAAVADRVGREGPCQHLQAATAGIHCRPRFPGIRWLRCSPWACGH